MMVLMIHHHIFSAVIEVENRCVHLRMSVMRRIGDTVMMGRGVSGCVRCGERKRNVIRQHVVIIDEHDIDIIGVVVGINHVLCVAEIGPVAHVM